MESRRTSRRNDSGRTTVGHAAGDAVSLMCALTGADASIKRDATIDRHRILYLLAAANSPRRAAKVTAPTPAKSHSTY